MSVAYTKILKTHAIHHVYRLQPAVLVPKVFCWITPVWSVCRTCTAAPESKRSRSACDSFCTLCGMYQSPPRGRRPLHDASRQHGRRARASFESCTLPALPITTIFPLPRSTTRTLTLISKDCIKKQTSTTALARLRSKRVFAERVNDGRTACHRSRSRLVSYGELLPNVLDILIILPNSEEDLEHIKTFLTKFQVTRPPRQRQDNGDDEDRMEDEDDQLAPYDAEGSLKYKEQLVRPAT